MSQHAFNELSKRIHCREMAISPAYPDFQADIHALSKIEMSAYAAGGIYDMQLQQRQNEMLSTFGLEVVNTGKPFAFSSGVAVVPVHGTLINRYSYSWTYVTGYNFIRHQVAAAGRDPDVKGIILDVNSYGGEAAGAFECSSELRALAGGKPILTVIDSNCYSAGYAIGSAGNKMAMIPSGGVGSIGVVAMHVSYEKALNDFGIKITFIHAGEHKVDGNPMQDLSPAVKKDIQVSIDLTYDAFVALVVKNRGMDDKNVRATEARTYKAEEAKELGLIDAIATPGAAVQAFLSELSGSTSSQRKEESAMSTTTTTPGAPQTPAATAPDQAALAEAGKAAVAAERTRIAGITTCEEAKGREALANHLAMNTDMSVEVAKGVLKAAAPAVAEAKPNALEQAMAKSPNPNVGASDAAAGSEGNGEQTAAERIIANAEARGVLQKAGK